LKNILRLYYCVIHDNEDHINTQLDNNSIKILYLNKNHSFYNIILNKCWSSIASLSYYKYSNRQKGSYYTLILFGAFDYPERRRDFIYFEIFKTGDILIYKNKNDVT